MKSCYFAVSALTFILPPVGTGRSRLFTLQLYSRWSTHLAHWSSPHFTPIGTTVLIPSLLPGAITPYPPPSSTISQHTHRVYTLELAPAILLPMKYHWYTSSSAVEHTTSNSRRNGFPSNTTQDLGSRRILMLVEGMSSEWHIHSHSIMGCTPRLCTFQGMCKDRLDPHYSRVCLFQFVVHLALIVASIFHGEPVKREHTQHCFLVDSTCTTLSGRLEPDVLEISLPSSTTCQLRSLLDLSLNANWLLNNPHYNTQQQQQQQQQHDSNQLVSYKKSHQFEL